MNEITFITGNAAKAQYLADYFHFPVTHRKLDLDEIQSLDLEKIVRDKAERAYAIVQATVLVEDTSLTFEALNGLPGPLVKWFYEPLGNEGLCKLLNGCENRNAIAEVKFALCDGSGTHVFTGSREGSIADLPRGEKGFGWDPIFIPKGYTQTWAEMPESDKHASSMRKIALEQLAHFLTDPNTTS